MSRPKVSIVVPIYNVEKYLKQCIDSLLNQTLKDIEIILVDDGTPDLAGQIADEYASNYANVKVIHQKNAGLGPARNTGIKHASGEYVGFVDSDDWVDSKMYQKLYNLAIDNKADIVVSGHCDVANDKIVKTKAHPLAGNCYSDKKDLLEIRNQIFGHAHTDAEIEAFPMSVCMSLYRNEYLKMNDLKFENVISEDTVFNLFAYKFANCIYFSNATDYFYRKEEQVSITNSFSEKKLEQYKRFLLRINDIAMSEDDKINLERVSHTAIDIGRLYVGNVVESNLSFREKKKQIYRFTNDKIINDIIKRYPVSTLSFMQKIFQFSLTKHLIVLSMILYKLRKLKR